MLATACNAINNAVIMLFILLFYVSFWFLQKAVAKLYIFFGFHVKKWNYFLNCNKSASKKCRSAAHTPSCRSVAGLFLRKLLVEYTQVNESIMVFLFYTCLFAICCDLALNGFALESCFSIDCRSQLLGSSPSRNQWDQPAIMTTTRYTAPKFSTPVSMAMPVASLAASHVYTTTFPNFPQRLCYVFPSNLAMV